MLEERPQVLPPLRGNCACCDRVGPLLTPAGLYLCRTHRLELARRILRETKTRL